VACRRLLRRRRHQRGGALIETALVLPVLLMLVFGIVGTGRIVQARIGVSGVAREAARAAALADTAAQASSQGMQRAQEVASGYRLTNGSLQVTLDPGSFDRGGQVRSDVQYDVPLQDLPLLHWLHMKVEAHDVERIDLYRSRWSVPPQ
jgi:Flp pilus assembly protein TadG